MRGTRTVHGNGTNTTPPQTDRTAHRTQRHDTLCPAQNHRSQQNQAQQQPRLHFHWDSHLYPFHGRLNQNKNYSMKKGNGKVKRKEKKRKYKLFFTLQVINWLLIGCSHLKLTEWRQGTSPALWNAFLRMGRKIIFFLFMLFTQNFPYTQYTVRIIGVNKTVKTQLSEST